MSDQSDGSADEDEEEDEPLKRKVKSAKDRFITNMTGRAAKQKE